MKILFLDDCYRKGKKYLGYGGFCIDQVNVKTLCDDVSMLKRRYGIPHHVELKWSPDPNHYLRTKFKGSRQQLNRDAVSLLHKYEVTVICAVHNLSDCYGMQLYDWSIKRAALWGAKQQFKFLSERFEKPYLEKSNDVGIVVADHCSDRRDESAIIKELDLIVSFGTEFRKFEKICMAPMMALSEYCPPVQLADLVVGIVVCSLANSRYALELFEDIALLFLMDSCEGTSTFGSTCSASMLGFGLKLFPRSFMASGVRLLEQMDDKYICTSGGVREHIANVRERWPVVLENVSKEKFLISAFLMEGKPVELQGRKLKVAFGEEFSFHRNSCERTENKNLIEKVLQGVFNKKLELCCIEDKPMKCPHSAG